MMVDDADTTEYPQFFSAVTFARPTLSSSTTICSVSAVSQQWCQS